MEGRGETKPFPVFRGSSEMVLRPIRDEAGSHGSNIRIPGWSSYQLDRLPFQEGFSDEKAGIRIRILFNDRYFLENHMNLTLGCIIFETHKRALQTPRPDLPQ